MTTQFVTGSHDAGDKFSANSSLYSVKLVAQASWIDALSGSEMLNRGFGTATAEKLTT